MNLEERFQQAEDSPEFWRTRLHLDLTTALQQAMQDQGVKRYELADRVGRARSFISKLMNSQSNPTLGTIARLARALGLRPALRLLRPDQDVIVYTRPEFRQADMTGVEGTGNTTEAWESTVGPSLSIPNEDVEEVLAEA